MAVSREDVQRFLDGHRRANDVTRAETHARLRTLTVEESQAEYDALCRVWEAGGGPVAGREALDRLVLRDRLALRRRLARLR